MWGFFSAHLTFILIELFGFFVLWVLSRLHLTLLLTLLAVEENKLFPAVFIMLILVEYFYHSLGGC